MFERRAKAFREAAGLTQSQAAMDIGVAPATIDSWERKGKKRP